jgi:hypothetical protein
MQFSRAPLKPWIDKLNINAESVDDLKESVQHTSDTLKSMSEQLRLKLRLARMEVLDKRDNITDTIDGVSHSLIEAVRDLDKKISDSNVQFHLGLMESQEKWKRLKHRAADMFDALKKEEVLGHQIFDEVILKTSLAKMETREFLGRSRDELNKTWQQVSQQSMVALRKMNEGIGDLFHRLS